MRICSRRSTIDLYNKTSEMISLISQKELDPLISVICACFLSPGLEPWPKAQAYLHQFNTSFFDKDTIVFPAKSTFHCRATGKPRISLPSANFRPSNPRPQVSGESSDLLIESDDERVSLTLNHTLLPYSCVFRCRHVVQPVSLQEL